jgi:hypothetical protein
LIIFIFFNSNFLNYKKKHFYIYLLTKSRLIITIVYKKFIQLIIIFSFYFFFLCVRIINKTFDFIINILFCFYLFTALVREMTIFVSKNLHSGRYQSAFTSWKGHKDIIQKHMIENFPQQTSPFLWNTYSKKLYVS